MQTYYVVICEEGNDVMLKVKAPNAAWAMHKAFALHNEVDIDDVDLDTVNDINLYVFEENEIVDHTA